MANLFGKEELKTEVAVDGGLQDTMSSCKNKTIGGIMPYKLDSTKFVQSETQGNKTLRLYKGNQEAAGLERKARREAKRNCKSAERIGARKREKGESEEEDSPNAVA